MVKREEEPDQGGSSRKYKAGPALGTLEYPPSKSSKRIREFAAQWGQNRCPSRTFGESGPGLEVDFQVWRRSPRLRLPALTEGTFTTLLEQQAPRRLQPRAPLPRLQAALPGGPGGPTSWMSRGANSLATTNPSAASVPSADGTFPSLRAVLRSWTATATTARRLCSRSLRLPPNCPRTPTPLTPGRPRPALPDPARVTSARSLLRSALEFGRCPRRQGWPGGNKRQLRRRGWPSHPRWSP